MRQTKEYQQKKSPCQAAGALPNFPFLFRERFTGQSIEQLPKGRAEYQLCTASQERNKKVFITYFFGHIVDTDTAAYLFTLDEEREQRGLYEVDMAGEFTNLNIYIQALGEKVYI